MSLGSIPIAELLWTTSQNGRSPSQETNNTESKQLIPKILVGTAHAFDEYPIDEQSQRL